MITEQQHSYLRNLGSPPEKVLEYDYYLKVNKCDYTVIQFLLKTGWSEICKGGEIIVEAYDNTPLEYPYIYFGIKKEELA